MAELFGQEKSPQEQVNEWMGVARAREDAGDDRGAEEALRKAITADPSNSAPALAVAELYERRGEDTRAVLELRQAAGLMPTDSAPDRRVGELFLRQDRYAGAADAFESALAKSPTDMELSRLYIIALLGAGKVSEGRVELARLLERGPNNPENLALDALALAAEGQVSVARIRLESAAQSSSLAFPSRLLGIFYLREGEPSAAVQAFKSAREKGADDPWTLRLMAQALTEAGQGEEAVALLAPILKQRPLDSLMLSIYARALVSRGAYEEALTAAKRAVKQNPSLAMAHLAKGDAYAALERPDDAVASYKAASSASRTMVAPYRRLAAVQRSRGRSFEASMALEQVVALAPGDRHARLELLECYILAATDLDKASALLKVLLSEAPSDAQVLDLKLKLESKEKSLKSGSKGSRRARRPVIMRGR